MSWNRAEIHINTVSLYFYGSELFNHTRVDIFWRPRSPSAKISLFSQSCYLISGYISTKISEHKPCFLLYLLFADWRPFLYWVFWSCTSISAPAYCSGNWEQSAPCKVWASVKLWQLKLLPLHTDTGTHKLVSVPQLKLMPTVNLTANALSIFLPFQDSGHMAIQRQLEASQYI